MISTDTEPSPTGAKSTASDSITRAGRSLDSSAGAFTISVVGSEVVVFSLFFGGLILLIGHSINLGLGIIALFVHGLRLNTLEFARQVGVIWSGRAFEPLARFQLQGVEER